MNFPGQQPSWNISSLHRWMIVSKQCSSSDVQQYQVTLKRSTRHNKKEVKDLWPMEITAFQFQWLILLYRLQTGVQHFRIVLATIKYWTKLHAYPATILIGPWGWDNIKYSAFPLPWVNTRSEKHHFKSDQVLVLEGAVLYSAWCSDSKPQCWLFEPALQFTMWQHCSYWYDTWEEKTWHSEIISSLLWAGGFSKYS